MSLFRSSLAGIFLVLTVSIAFAADAPANRQDIQVTLSNFSFAPNMLRLQRNMSYAIHLVNSASGGHSFSAPGFFAAVAVAPEDGGKIVNGKVEIPAGQTVDITVTPMTAGSYPIVCTHFLHTTFGMRGNAVIE
ncbi:MAG TPA: cupredoxin domain-containing protein [Micropepsaceae bacterium]|nr:cupredoxin domain-containing protein [Micropepsaceae bacterium]